MVHNMDRFRSVSAQHASESVSGGYSFIPTTRVLDVLSAEGWAPSKVSEARTLKESRIGFQKHMVRLCRQSDMEQRRNPGALIPEVVLTNAHDGSASFQIMAGLFRVVCSNGLVVADSMFAAHRIKHMGYADVQVAAALQDVVTNVPRVLDRVQGFQALQLTDGERASFAEAALIVKADGEEDKLPEGWYKDRTISALLQPRREADAAPTLWNTFNTIQEKFLNGGRFLMQDHGRNRGRAGKTRAVSSVDRNVALNKALWTLTEKMAELKGVA